jgi:ribosomal protein S18 acetylase RimI-like enzyme
MTIALRPATLEDVAFLADVVITATRAQGRFGDDVDEAAYRAGYEDWTRETVLGHIPDCTLSVIERDGQPIGRLRVLRNETSITLAGIQLLPAYQNQGIGTTLVTQLQREADQWNIPLRIAVEKDNPNAQRLYERLGCRVIGEDAQECQLEYRPRAGVGPQTRPSGL